MEDIYVDIRNIGAIFGVSERAEALIAELEQQIAATKERIAGQPPLRALVYDSGEGPLNVVGGNSSRYAVFKALGVENVFPELPDGGYGPVSIEEVAAREADVVVVLGYSFPGVATSEERAAFITRTFPNNPAVQNGRVVIFPYGFMNPSIQNARGVEELAKLLYPDAFK